jgi:hypothetical protein
VAEGSEHWPSRLERGIAGPQLLIFLPRGEEATVVCLTPIPPRTLALFR